MRLLLVYSMFTSPSGSFADCSVVIGATSLPIPSGASSVVSGIASGPGTGTANGTALPASQSTSAGDRMRIGMRLSWLGALVMLRFI